MINSLFILASLFHLVFGQSRTPFEVAAFARTHRRAALRTTSKLLASNSLDTTHASALIHHSISSTNTAHTARSIAFGIPKLASVAINQLLDSLAPKHRKLRHSRLHKHAMSCSEIEIMLGRLHQLLGDNRSHLVKSFTRLD